MRILYFSFAELDIPNACQTHTLGVLKGFGSNGCKVDALIPRPLYVRPEIPGVRFYYLWPWRFSRIGKAWIKFLSGLIMFCLCLARKYDSIYVRELENNPIPRWCSKLFLIKYFIEVNGILLLKMKDDGVSSGSLRRAEKHQSSDFKQASGLIVPSFPRYRWLTDYYGLNQKKVHMVLNGANISKKEKADRLTALRKLKLPGKGFYLGFLGNLWEHYDLPCILKAMELCNHIIPELHLIIIGGGTGIDNLKKRAHEMHLISKLVFLGYIQPELLYEAIGAIDIGLISLTQKGLQDLGPITTRFATYSVFHIPLIGNSTFMENYPEKIRHGLSVVPPEDPEALSEMIIHLYRHPEERKEKGKILHDFVLKNLTWDSVTKEILDIMRNDKHKAISRK